MEPEIIRRIMEELDRQAKKGQVNPGMAEVLKNSLEAGQPVLGERSPEAITNEVEQGLDCLQRLNVTSQAATETLRSHLGADSVQNNKVRSREEILALKALLEEVADFLENNPIRGVDEQLDYICDVIDCLGWVLGEETTDVFLSDAYMDLTSIADACEAGQNDDRV